jgi:hypothetical protein
MRIRRKLDNEKEVEEKKGINQWEKSTPPILRLFVGRNPGLVDLHGLQLPQAVDNP